MAQEADLVFLDRRDLRALDDTTIGVSVDLGTMRDEFSLDADTVRSEDIEVVEKIDASGRIELQLPDEWVNGNGTDE